MLLSRSQAVVLASLLAASGTWASVAGQQRGQPLPPTGPGKGFLSGQVVDANNDRPIAGAQVVTVAVAGRIGAPQAPVVADSQGRFFFANLPAGSYQFQILKAGYSMITLQNYLRTIDLTEAERITTLKFRLVRLASIGGVVRDDGGDPVPGVDVMAFDRTVTNGRLSLRRFTQARTDDRGAYRLTSLRPGDYFVCACARDPIPFDGLLLTTLAADPIQLMGAAARALRVGSDVVAIDSTLRTFAPTFHPNSPLIARATRITLAAGEDKTGVDVDIAPVRAARVSGTIVGAPNPIVAQSLRLIPAGESEEGATISQLAPVLVQPDGRFDFAGVPPGRYVLRVTHVVTGARGGAPSGSALGLIGARGATMGSLNSGPIAAEEPYLWANQTIGVGEDGLTGLVIPLRRGTALSGRVQFIGTAPPPDARTLSNSSVLLQPVNPDPGERLPSQIRLNPDATFLFPGVPPGRYILSPNTPWNVLKSVVVGGVDVTDLALEIGERELSDVVITLSDSPRTVVSGSLANGPLGRDVSFLMFPADHRYWPEPAAARRRFAASAVDLKGTFRIQGLPAGDYFYVVIPDEAAVDWQIASRLETLSRNASRITLADGQSVTLTVR